MNKRIRCLGVAALVLLLAACTGDLLQSKVAEPQVYVISPADVQPATVAYPVQIAISLPSAAPGLDTARIAVLRDGHRLDYFYGARWGGTAPQVVQSFLLSMLQTQQGLKSTFAENARLDADYLLELDLRDFQAEYGAGTAPTVHVVLAATLVHIQSRHSLGLLRAEARVPTQENRLGAVVPAFQTALQQASLSLSEQLAELLKNPPAAP